MNDPQLPRPGGPELVRKTRLLYRCVSWLGFGFFAFGTASSMLFLVRAIQAATGWGLTPVERCCVEVGKASLAGGLGAMFFVLLGAGVILLLHPVRAYLARAGEKKPARWQRWIAAWLLIYALAAFGVATIVAGMREELEEITPGIVNYCMLVGVGMLAAAWGFQRAAKAQ